MYDTAISPTSSSIVGDYIYDITTSYPTVRTASEESQREARPDHKQQAQVLRLTAWCELELGNADEALRVVDLANMGTVTVSGLMLRLQSLLQTTSTPEVIDAGKMHMAGIKEELRAVEAAALTHQQSGTEQ